MPDETGVDPTTNGTLRGLTPAGEILTLGVGILILADDIFGRTWN
jgi:hypothetical protein